MKKENYFLTGKEFFLDETGGFARIVDDTERVEFIPIDSCLYTSLLEEDDPETFIDDNNRDLLIKTISKEDFEKAKGIVDEGRNNILKVLQDPSIDYSQINPNPSTFKKSDLVIFWSYGTSELFRVDEDSPLKLSRIADFSSYIRLFEDDEIEVGEYDEEVFNETNDDYILFPQDFYDRILKAREKVYEKLTDLYNQLL